MVINMAYYAFLDENNIVVQVIPGKHEDELLDGLPIDWERFYANETRLKCKRTSYNTLGNVHINGGIPFRKNHAGIGYSYDSVRDAFIPPQPYPSWTLNEETCLWVPPVPQPTDVITAWDEETLSWRVWE